MNEQMKRFRKKLYVEAGIQCLLDGFVAGLLTTSLFLLFIKKASLPISYLGAILFGVAAFVLSFGIRFWMLRPTEKRIAARLDNDFHLNEKVKTMVHYKDSENEMVIVQREQTNRILSSFSPKQLTIRIALLSLIFTFVSGGTFAYSVMTPKRQVEKPGFVEENPEDKVDELISLLEHSRIDEVIKNKLLEILYRVLEVLQSEEATKDEKIAVIDEAIEKVIDIIEHDLSKNLIGQALQLYDLTERLGQAIEQANQEKLNEALEEMKQSILSLSGVGQKTLLKTIATTIQDAIDPLVPKEFPENDELYAVLKNFANAVKRCGIKVYNESSKPTLIEDVISTFEQGKKEIWEALEHQLSAQEMCEEVIQILQQLRNQLENPNPPSETPDQGGDSTSGSGQNQPKPSEGTSGQPSSGDDENPDGDGGEFDGVQYAGNETVLDKDSNTNVEYGELIDAYYQYIVSVMEDYPVDGELTQLLNDYFYQLYYGSNGGEGENG